jgi:nitroreductase
LVRFGLKPSIHAGFPAGVTPVRWVRDWVGSGHGGTLTAPCCPLLPLTAMPAFALRFVGQEALPPRLSEFDREQFFTLTRQRKSVRWFLDKPVPRELIDKAMLAAGLAPSACNRQPYEFRVFDQKEQVALLSQIPMGTRGFAHNFPVFIVIVGNLDAYFDERDRHVIYVDGSLASMTFMLALETLGLSSCPINWPDIESREKRMDNALGLQPHQRPIMCLAVGYPDPEGLVAYSEKRPLDDVRSYNV